MNRKPQKQEYEIEIEMVLRHWFKTHRQRAIEVIEAESAEEAMEISEMLLEMANRATPNKVAGYVVGIRKI